MQVVKGIFKKESHSLKKKSQSNLNNSLKLKKKFFYIKYQQ